MNIYVSNLLIFAYISCLFLTIKNVSWFAIVVDKINKTVKNKFILPLDKI